MKDSVSKLFYKYRPFPRLLRRRWVTFSAECLSIMTHLISPHLRPCFSKATVKKVSRGTLMVAAFFVAAMGMTASSPQVNHNFSDILAELPISATPFTQTKTKAVYKTDFISAREKFVDMCPAIEKQAVTEDEVAAWMTGNLTTADFKKAPVEFRDRAYRLTATLSQTDNKEKLLIDISQTLPDSKILTDYLTAKRFEIAAILQADPEIVRVNKNWNKIADNDYKTRVLQRIANITLDTLLPHKNIDYPRVRWITEGLTINELAYYRSQTNEIHINGALDPSRYTFQFALDIVMHEATHAFQDILIAYGLNGEFKNHADINRYVSIMYDNRSADAGAFRFDKDNATSQLGYHLMKTESMAWGFARIGQTISRPHITEQTLSNLVGDMYTKIDIVEPHRTLPNAQFVAEIPTPQANPFEGVIPSMCR